MFGTGYADLSMIPFRETEASFKQQQKKGTHVLC
jgi:hypothetical protein